MFIWMSKSLLKHLVWPEVVHIIIQIAFRMTSFVNASSIKINFHTFLFCINNFLETSNKHCIERVNIASKHHHSVNLYHNVESHLESHNPILVYHVQEKSLVQKIIYSTQCLRKIYFLFLFFFLFLL